MNMHTHFTPSLRQSLALDLDMVVFVDVRLRLRYFSRSLFLALLSYLSVSDRLVVCNPVHELFQS